MKRAAKLVLGVAAVAVVLGLFLVPIVPITVASTEGTQNSSIVTGSYTASASMMYAYLGLGAVYVPSPPNPYGAVTMLTHSYCLMVGNPGTMCGYSMQRMMG